MSVGVCGRAAWAMLWCAVAAQAQLQMLWRPVEPEELALKAPKVEKDADAEALSWDVYVQYDTQGDYPRTVFMNYLRIKVFNERGRDQQSTVSIPYIGRNHISDIAGRTIKPDGTIIELKKDAIFDKDVIKGSGIKLKAKSFAMPGVEPGSIIEYRWKEVHADQIANYVRLHFQREIPVQVVTYHLKPLVHWAFPYAMRTMTFQVEPVKFERERDGFYAAREINMPSFREEPYMPPEDQVRSWMLVYYSENKNLSPEKYWHATGKQTYEAAKPLLKVNGDVKRIAAEVTGDAGTPEEKLQRLFHYCRTKLKNIYAEGTTAEERLDVKQNKSPSDTLKQGAGTGRDINLAFAALATAAGFDARYARVSDRGDTFFHRGDADDYFLRSYNIAVKVNDQWRFFDLSSNHIPYGMLRWQEEGIDALVTDPKEPVFVRTPMTLPAKSQRKRIGNFELDEEGTLSGDVQLTYTGHEAISRRAGRSQESAAEAEEDVKKGVTNRFSTAEVSKIKIDNLNDAEKPLVYTYHVNVPGYAQRTGKRLFLQMGFFQQGLAAMFPNSTRRYDLYFSHPWSEDDTVVVKLPEGYSLDHAEAPNPVRFNPVGAYDVTVGVMPDGKLLYTRKFSFGESGNILFPVKAYSQLKTIFDRVHEEDAHTITLKQGTPAGAKSAGANE